jgi:VWFA-related protein
MRMRQLLLFSALSGSVLPGAVFGQTISPRQNQRQPPPPRTENQDVVRVSTNLIQIDATVVDKDGNIVSGLTADDFEIYENNKKQQITNFSFIDVQPTRSEGFPAVKKKNVPAVPPMPGSLRPEQVRRTVALVVDDLGLSFGSIDKVKNALKKFVDEQMQPGDLVAIIRTSSGVGVLQQFTSDKRILYAAIKRVRWSNGRGGIDLFPPINPSDQGAAKQAQSGSAGSMLAGNKTFNEFREDVFATGTLGAVNYVVKGMRELPGRKAAVVFSDGFSVYGPDTQKPSARVFDSFQRLIESANRASVMIYPMDAGGVVNPLFVGADESFEDFVATGNPVIGQAILGHSHGLTESQQSARDLAARTGAFAVLNNNDLNKGLGRVLNDQKSYYLIGYRPDGATFDPQQARFHSLTVKLNRSDLHVRYRSGFFGFRDDELRSAPKTARQQILAALTSPLTTGDMDLRLTSLFLKDDMHLSVRSLVYIDGQALKFTEDRDGWQKATFDIVSMIFGDNADIVDEVSRTETIRARADTLREIREKGFVATIDFPIKKPAGYQMRVVLRDSATGNIGSASQFIEVPDLKKHRLALSGIVLEKYAARQGATPQASEFQSDELRHSATRRFHSGDTVKFDLSVYDSRTDRTARASLAMTFTVYRDGKEIFVASEAPLKSDEQTNQTTLEASGAFELGQNMPPGDYLLRVTVTDLMANKKFELATQWTDFEILP